MKKILTAVILAAMILVEAAFVFAAVSPYVDPLSMTTETTSVVREAAPAASTIGGYRTITFPVKQPCKLDMTVSPRDPYFIGRQKAICVNQNKGNLFCQQQCVDKMKLYILTGAYQRNLQLYSAGGCASADLAAVKAVKSANQCYFVAGNSCADANPSNDFCRRKCVQNAYAVCRQGIAGMRYTN